MRAYVNNIRKLHQKLHATKEVNDLEWLKDPNKVIAFLDDHPCARVCGECAGEGGQRWGARAASRRWLPLRRIEGPRPLPSFVLPELGIVLLCTRPGFLELE